MENVPVGITVNRETNVMTIRWKDGHESEYPYPLLRYACPCVECQGGHDQMSRTPDPAVFEKSLQDNEQTHIEAVEAVGSYALTIVWEDGHSAGIYDWNYMRLLCPCPECRGA